MNLIKIVFILYGQLGYDLPLGEEERYGSTEAKNTVANNILAINIGKYAKIKLIVPLIPHIVNKNFAACAALMPNTKKANIMQGEKYLEMVDANNKA